MARLRRLTNAGNASIVCDRYSRYLIAALVVAWIRFALQRSGRHPTFLYRAPCKEGEKTLGRMLAYLVLIYQ